MKKQTLLPQNFALAAGNPVARALLLLIIAALPWLAGDFFQLPKLAFDNFTDAVFYPAYATNFSELVLRHGFVYYAMRFGVIFPDALFSWFFGTPEGWLILRAAFQSVLLILIFLFFEKKGGWASGAIAILLWWTSPVALRTLCTTYLDSLAVPFFVAGALLLAWPGAKVWMALLAGVLWGLAASAHLYLLILMPLMMPFIAGNRWKERKAGAISMVWGGVGAFSAWGIGYAYYRGVWGVVDIWAPTKEFMGGMAAGDAEIWRSPFLEVISQTPAWFAPIFVLAGAAFLLRRDAMPLWGAWLSLGATAAFFWLGDLVGGAYALSMPMYFSYLFPALFLATATGLSEVMMRGLDGKSANWQARLAGAPAFLLLAALLIGSSSAITRIMTPSIAWLTIALLMLAVVAGFWIFPPQKLRRWQYVPFLVALCASQILVLATPFYSQYLAKYKRLHREELWQPELAAQLSRILPPAALDGRSLRFWYDDSQPGLIRMVQASQLYRFSMLLDSNGVPANFPEPTEDILHSINDSGVEVIVVLDEKPDPVEKASGILKSRLQDWSTSQEGMLKYRHKKIFYVILERSSFDEAPVEAAVALQWNANKPAQLVPMAGGKSLLRSSSRKWMFEAESPLPDQAGGGSIFFLGQVNKGRFLLALLDSNDATLASTELWPTTAPMTRILSFPPGLKELRLVLRNMMPEGTDSEIVITHTSAIEKNSSSRTEENSIFPLPDE